ncbi:DASH complex subunit Ask1-domain-containing protein [Thermoascus aurantiacus ATCC 26904]
MSRPAPPAQRNLTLTEELEKLEQSITLTLQEIDHNFSRAHQILTTRILPIVEQYKEHSRDVWEGAKFWKQFFEASANVSLSGYEEQPNNEDSQQEQTVTAEGDTTTVTDATHTTLNEAASPSSEHLDLSHRDEDIDLTSLTISASHSTPRAQHHQKQRRAADDDHTTSSIPYEPTLQQSELGDADATSELRDADGRPTTPGKQRSQDTSTTPTSSPLLPPAPHEHEKPSTAKKKNPYQKPTDPVLHRVADKTYRVQATPLRKRGFGPTKFTVTPKDKNKPVSRYPFDDSPISSPEPEAPKLNEEIFASSPLKAEGLGGTGRKPRATSLSRVTPRPGISVLTPTKNKQRAVWDSDDDLDDDDDFGYSPPKTMQFHIPQSRLMKTPAKEASKRIVTDLLTTAGGDITSEYGEEQSPSVIGRAKALEDETF